MKINYAVFRNPIEVMENIQKFIKANKPEGYTLLDEIDKVFYNYANWISLVRKGVMMIEEYKRTILPQIDEVISIQKKVDLPNADGDNIIGFIDFTGKLKGEDFVRTCDNKTSGRKYKPRIGTRKSTIMYLF